MQTRNSQPSATFLRIWQIIGNRKADPPVPPLIPIGKSSWWQKVRSGEALTPIKIGRSVTAWRASDTEAYIATLSTKLGGE